MIILKRNKMKSRHRKKMTCNKNRKFKINKKIISKIFLVI